MTKILLSLLLTVIYAQGTFSGVTYFDYTYDLSKDAINDDGFGLKRVYFTYKQDLSENISYKFQTDVGQLEVVALDEDDQLDGTKKTQFVAYLKKAQLDWKTSYGKLIFGMQGMNIFNVTEKTWGFRFLQKSAMDKYKFSSSADMGIGYSGKFNNLNYSFMYTNGCGYKKSENDEHKKISAQFVYGEKKLVKNDGFNIGLSFAFEPYDEEQEDEESTIITNNTMLLSLYSGYAKNGLRVGGEFDRYRDDGSNLTKQIIAAYISYQFTEKLQGLFYIDNYESDKYNDGDVNTDMIIGLNYKPEKGLTMTPNIRISTPEEGDSTTMFMLNFEFKF